jgi:hypothetical protein
MIRWPLGTGIIGGGVGIVKPGRAVHGWSSPATTEQHSTPAREAAMLKQVFSIGVMVVVTMAAPAALAANLHERLQADRMTVAGVDQAVGRFLGAEHRRWILVVKADLRDVRPGEDPRSNFRGSPQGLTREVDLLLASHHVGRDDPGAAAAHGGHLARLAWPGPAAARVTPLPIAPRMQNVALNGA